MYSANRYLLFLMSALLFSLQGCEQKQADLTAADILGNPDYPALCFGGYRHNTRSKAPTTPELKEDLRILSAMGIKLLRTYHAQQFPETVNLLEAIRELKAEDPSFEMYLMLGAWIECENAWTANANHAKGNETLNAAEVNAAIEFAKNYPDIVKVIAVGNESMVHWAATYFVQPAIVLKWVEHVQQHKKEGELPESLWVTSSDNFASWGGGDDSYHNKDLTQLLQAVDFVSLHTYPFHDSHYNPAFWIVPQAGEDQSELEQVNEAMERAKLYAISQYQSAADYIMSLGIDKPIHIGETGWASGSNKLYGPAGSKAADEYKEKLYYQFSREWTKEMGMSCFYFEAFDEPWKDAENPGGSENHFGLINIEGQAKYMLWDLVDQGVFNGLTRNGQPITKTFDGNEGTLLSTVSAPPFSRKLGDAELP